MYLILFLIIGIYLYIKISADKSSARKAREEHEERSCIAKNDFGVFCDKYEDSSLERSIMEDTGIKHRVAALIRDKFEIEPTRKMICMVAMAERGKIPHDIIEKWIGVPILGNNAEIQKQWDIQQRFLLWYNELLREHGVAEDLLFFQDVTESVHGSQDMMSVQRLPSDCMMNATWFSTRYKPLKEFVRIIHPSCLTKM